MKFAAFVAAAGAVILVGHVPAATAGPSDAGPSLTGIRVIPKGASHYPPHDLKGAESAEPSYAEYRAYALVQRSNDAERIATHLVDEAKLGKVWAMRELGGFYSGENRLANHPEKSLYWYHEAAVLGDAQSALVVGSAFARGIVVEKEERLARFWLTKAVEYGDWRVKRDAKALLASL